jgi:hypothetical protein
VQIVGSSASPKKRALNNLTVSPRARAHESVWRYHSIE